MNNQDQKWCKNCKYGYGCFRGGKLRIYCYLPNEYPEEKDSFETCDDWEEA